MPKIKVQIETDVEVSDANPELIKVLGREIIAGIAQSTNNNVNVEDITVTDMKANVSYSVDCMPEQEINELG